MISALSPLARLLVLMQFFHWFNPSQPYVRDFIIPHYNITDVTLRDQVYAWDVLAELVGGILMATLYVLTGPVLPLLISNLGAFLMTAILVFGTTYTALLTSQFMFAIGFTALFLVSSTLYHTEEVTAYQAASSFNSSAMLGASTLAGIIGFAIAMSSAATTSFTLYVAMASTAVALVLNCIAIPQLLRRTDCPVWNKAPDSATKRLLQEPEASAETPSQSTWQLLRPVLTNRKVIYWLLAYSSIRAMHTLIIMLWGILSATIAPNPATQRYNGLITFAGYGLGMLGVLQLAARKVQVHERAEGLTVGACVLCGVLLACMPSTTTLWEYGILHVIYNAVSETIMAMVVTQLAWAVKGLPEVTVHNEQSLFGISMAVRFTVSLIMQALLQLVLYPRWGQVDNMFGMDLDVKEQFRALGGLMVGLGVVLGTVSIVIGPFQSLR
eukprot:m.41214 g.41214  ORF g.41214 m.41214 type:complete len:441 (+) comp12815_c0_seq1:84-1406(+)